MPSFGGEITMIAKGSDGYYHPANEEEVRELIEHAVRDVLKIRVRGSAHSVPAAVYTGNFESPPPNESNINILMDKMRAVSFDDDQMQVTVGAGCHLGASPDDPTGTATVEKSLFYQLDRKGWAFPDTGGIIHQTVGGFLSTGSSGGSVSHSVGKSVVAARLIDGSGTLHELRTGNPDDPSTRSACRSARHHYGSHSVCRATISGRQDYVVRRSAKSICSNGRRQATCKPSSPDGTLALGGFHKGVEDHRLEAKQLDEASPSSASHVPSSRRLWALNCPHRPRQSAAAPGILQRPAKNTRKIMRAHPNRSGPIVNNFLASPSRVRNSRLWWEDCRWITA
jgi:hypothetical protein